MKRFVMVLSMVAILLSGCVFVGCTAPAQKIGQTGLETAYRQFETVHNDLVKIAKQAALDKAARGTVGGDAAYEALANDLEKISWLDREWVKARFGPGGLALQYIASQRGLFDILSEEWAEAKAATQPAP